MGVICTNLANELGHHLVAGGENKRPVLDSRGNAVGFAILLLGECRNCWELPSGYVKIAIENGDL